MRRATAGERIARGYAAVVVALRVPVVLGWVAALVAAVALLPALGGSGGAPLDDIVPADAAATSAQERALELFGTTLATDSVLVQRNPEGLSRRELEQLAGPPLLLSEGAKLPQLRGVKAAVPLVNVPLPGVRWREVGTTALTYLFLDPELSLVKRREAAERYARQLGPPREGTTRALTGAGPGRLAQFEAIEGVLPLVTGVTVLLIVLIVALTFRSIGAPLITLFTAGVAYVLATRVLAWTSERAGVTAPSEIEPVLVVLLLGLVTDYTVFFLAEARRALREGARRVPAARDATRRIAPIVLTAGTLVAAGAASLLAGELQFFRVFGPGLALAALVVTLVCVTLVPALIGLFGPRLFGRLAPLAPARNLGSRLFSGRVGGTLLALLCVAGLAYAAAGARSAQLAVSFIPSLPPDDPVRVAADDATRGFVPGVLAPTDLVLEQDGLEARPAELGRLQRLLMRERGVAAVLGPAQAPEERLRRLVVTRDGRAARYIVLLDSEPTGARAIDDLQALQARLPALARRAGLPPGARFGVGGETALAAETVDALVADLWRVGLATAAVTFLLLALFLRSLVAPVLLLVGSVLAFAAAFGLTSLVLGEQVGGSDFVYYVPLVAAVLLVGLGSDYNVFIAGRIREEARRRRLREAIAVGAPSAGRAITIAGLTLAASFAVLALVPLRPFRELALLMTIGVLVDALFVRPVLIPALLAMAGRFAWWPWPPERRLANDPFLEEVARRTGRGLRDAEAMAVATLATLAERVPAREAEEIAAHLPAALAEPVLTLRERRDPFGADEFIRRVAGRGGVPVDVARRDAMAVLATLGHALPHEELDYVRAALPDDYRPLFGDIPEPAPA